MGLDDGIRILWKSANSIQVPDEEETKTKVSEECAVDRRICTQEKLYNDTDQIGTKVIENCKRIKDSEVAKEKAKEKCHEFCNQNQEYPVYIWHKANIQDGRCLFTKDPTNSEYKNEDWHYELCPTTPENYESMMKILPWMIVKLNQEINQKLDKIIVAYQGGYKSNVIFGSTSIISIILAGIVIAIGSIVLFLYHKRKSTPSHMKYEMKASS